MPQTAQEPKNRKLLIVDDDAVVRSVIHQVVARCFPSSEIREAVDGCDALHQLSSFRPSVMILDLMLPYLSGDALCRFIQKRPRDFSTRIIGISGCVDESMQSQLFKNGVEDFLTKPLTERDLVISVSKLWGVTV